MDPGAPAHELTLSEAASVLRLPVASVEALVGAGYLRVRVADDDDRRFLSLSELKAFLARNAHLGDDASVEIDLTERGPDRAGPDVETEQLIAALTGRSEEMARRSFEILAAAFPEIDAWPNDRKERFVEHARDRFDAILAVSGHDAPLDDELIAELAEVGAAAARAGTALPEVLLTLRISRDLVVQTAVEVAQGRGAEWTMPLALLLMRVLPALDRLSDSITRGYWNAVVARETASAERYAHVVEHSASGVYEIDGDGRIVYANNALATIAGVSPPQLVGRRLDEVLVPADTNADLAPILGGDLAGVWSEQRVRRHDGVERVIEVQAQPRDPETGIVGVTGVVRDITATRELERLKNDFLAMITQELRPPLTSIVGLGITLDSLAEELAPERVRQLGRSIHRQAERIARLADDLFDISRLEANALLVTLREVDVRSAIEAAIGMVEVEAVDVDVEPGLAVRADARRLEQVIAHLLENAQRHGAPPIVIEAVATGGGVELTVRDHGSGVAPGIEASLFTQLRPSGDAPRYRDRPGGLGLPLVRGLVEAMGGRAWYEPADDGGACFIVALPGARRG